MVPSFCSISIIHGLNSCDRQTDTLKIFIKILGIVCFPACLISQLDPVLKESSKSKFALGKRYELKISNNCSLMSRPKYLHVYRSVLFSRFLALIKITAFCFVRSSSFLVELICCIWHRASVQASSIKKQ